MPYPLAQAIASHDVSHLLWGAVCGGLCCLLAVTAVVALIVWWVRRRRGHRPAGQAEDGT